MKMKVTAVSSLLALLVLAGGCSGPSGPKTMRVWGDVTYDGKPISEGTISFVPTDGGLPAQAPIKDGHYDLAADSGPLVEKTYRVEISALEPYGKAIPNVMDDSGPTMQPMRNVIPAVYNTNSTLKATISADSSKNQFDFKLDQGAAAKS